VLMFTSSPTFYFHVDINAVVLDSARAFVGSKRGPYFRFNSRLIETYKSLQIGKR